MSGNLRRASGQLLPPVIFGLLFLTAWQTFVRVADVSPFVLPAPTDIWSSATDEAAHITAAAGHSGLNALVGLLLGVVAGVLLAAIAARLPLLGNAVTPLVAALAAMPIVALAPLLNNMYSPLSPLPRREVVAISAFVPIFINVYRGLSRLSSVHRELMQSYAASPTQVLRTIRIPGALPHFFTGLRVASSLAVIAAVVSEYFGGLQDGLGARITSAAAFTAYPRAWAYVVGACVLGLIFYLATLVAERFAMPWRSRLAS
jgi:NitT/TauT family transport system permease protein